MFVLTYSLLFGATELKLFNNLLSYTAEHATHTCVHICMCIYAWHSCVESLSIGLTHQTRHVLMVTIEQCLRQNTDLPTSQHKKY